MVLELGSRAVWRRTPRSSAEIVDATGRLLRILPTQIIHRKSKTLKKANGSPTSQMGRGTLSSTRASPSPRRQPKAADLPLKRKRRVGADVSFNPDVYVRIDADVDVLRKQHTSLSEDFLEDKPAPKKPGPGILRTAPLKIDPTPSRPHTVIPLHPRDGRPRGPRDGHMYRQKRGYKLGQWAAGEGMERVNTNGHYLDFQIHLDNGVKLQQEAAALDNDEKFAELTAPLVDTEMDDAPVGDTPEATPAPEPIPISQQESSQRMLCLCRLSRAKWCVRVCMACSACALS
jgi:hypothetical protein